MRFPISPSYRVNENVATEIKSIRTRRLTLGVSVDLCLLEREYRRVFQENVLAHGAR